MLENSSLPSIHTFSIVEALTVKQLNAEYRVSSDVIFVAGIYVCVSIYIAVYSPSNIKSNDMIGGV